jgi:hypothetical protein
MSARKKVRREVSLTSFVSRSKVRASITDYPVGQELCAIVSASIDDPMVLAPLWSQIISNLGQRIDEENGHLMPYRIHGAAIAAIVALAVVSHRPRWSGRSPGLVQIEPASGCGWPQKSSSGPPPHWC